VRAYARSGAELGVSSDGAEFVLSVPHLPRGLLQDLGVGDPDEAGLACAITPPPSDMDVLAFLYFWEHSSEDIISYSAFNQGKGYCYAAE